MNNKRARLLNGIKLCKDAKGPVIYWMSRDQRIKDNWAFIFAQNTAIQLGSSLVIVFCAAPGYKSAPLRHYHFMFEGLKQASSQASSHNIPFFLLSGEPAEQISYFTKKIKAACLVTDFDPVNIKKEWKKALKDKINCSFYEVDAHNIVPCWMASGKQEFAAYTIRPKIKRLLGEFLEEFPELEKMPNENPDKYRNFEANTINFKNDDWGPILSKSCNDNSVKPVNWIKPGENSAFEMMDRFLSGPISQYNNLRNDPNAEGAVSNLSPYLHFGQISAQRVALEVLKTGLPEEITSAFLEELIIRRELSDNFCFYNDSYDRLESYPQWAKLSLKKHENDMRHYLYSIEELESCKTHDDLWNAAQLEMEIKGKMHGYLRMYWAKKILEWSYSPEQAVENAIYLNDRYELDGRDPNGYTGIAWSIGGLHDRAWGEREIYGKIRYMSYNGAKGKFDIKKYIGSVNYIAESADY